MDWAKNRVTDGIQTLHNEHDEEIFGKPLQHRLTVNGKVFDVSKEYGVRLGITILKDEYTAEVGNKILYCVQLLDILE